MKMRRVIIFICLSIILSPSFVLSSSNSLDTSNVEWKVAVGDSITYTYTKFFDRFDTDRNGDPFSRLLTIVNTDSEVVNITVKRGLKIKAMIHNLPESGEDSQLVDIQLSFNGITTEVNQYVSFLVGVIVRETIDNESYWKALEVHQSEVGTSYNFTISEYVEGNEFIREYHSIYSWGGVELTKSKVNWKTGWSTHSYMILANKTHTLSEFEVTTDPLALVKSSQDS